MTIKNANVAYNYQANPSLIVNTNIQNNADLTATLRSLASVNQTRNIFNVFPTKSSTPNISPGYLINSTTVIPDALNTMQYAGKQINGTGVK